MGVGSRELGVGSWESGVGSWESGVGGYRRSKSLTVTDDRLHSIALPFIKSLTR